MCRGVFARAVTLSVPVQFLVFMVALASLCISCDQPDYTSQELFPVQPGDSWVMENKFGDKTFYRIESGPTEAACESGSNFIMHVSKSSARTYWGDGIEGAEDREIFHRDANGEIRGIADIPIFPQSCPWCNGVTEETINWRPVDGEPLPYVIVPASIRRGQVIKMPTHYQGYIAADVNTDDCVAESQNYYAKVRWETVFYVADVDTPAYKGLTVVSEQFEGNGDPPVHEKWHFAPGLGLVQVDSYLTGGSPAMMAALKAEYGSDIITIKRVP